ncbi:hypothetical protein Avbf_14001 [Armadillidium vulgare]|nr:hypothetical protein Avbf_14001 [Armadillidium vulgare]
MVTKYYHLKIYTYYYNTISSFENHQEIRAYLSIYIFVLV